jgi:peptide deformylase
VAGIKEYAMSILGISKYPDAVLKKVAVAVSENEANLEKFVEDMFETMHYARGIGLAAPQVGVSKRVIVLDVSPVEETVNPLALVNPEIISWEGKEESEEGCLSVPDLTVKVLRAQKVTVSGYTPQWKLVKIAAEGILAVALQHEIDHLNGTLIVDYLSRLKRELYRKKIKKMFAKRL